MAWFKPFTGGSPSPPSTSPTYPSGMMQSSSASSSLAASQAGSIVAVNSLGSAPYWAAAQQIGVTSLDHNSKVYAIKSYADVIGWAFEHYRMPEGTTSNDPKIAILKISTIGEVIKDVGVRTSETDFYIMRAPSE